MLAEAAQYIKRMVAVIGATFFILLGALLLCCVGYTWYLFVWVNEFLDVVDVLLAMAHGWGNRLKRLFQDGGVQFFGLAIIVVFLLWYVFRTSLPV